MKRALEKGDIAEAARQLDRGGVALEPPAMPGEDYERKIGPWRLRGDPFFKQNRVAAADRLLGDNRHIGATVNLAHQVGNIGADVATEMRIAEDFARHCRIAAARSQDQGSLERLYQNIAQPPAPINGERAPI